MYVAVDKKGIIVAVSENSFEYKNHEIFEIEKSDQQDLIGKKYKKNNIKQKSELKIAYICNWGDCCGISTYTKFLVDEMEKKFQKLKFSQK